MHRPRPHALLVAAIATALATNACETKGPAVGSSAPASATQRAEAPLAPSSGSASTTVAASASAPAAAIAPHATPGRVEERTFASTALGVAKRYLVYVPPTYASDTARYPVIYLLHGLGGDETNWTQHGDLPKVADAMGLRALVVMPDGDAGFYVNGAQPTDYTACLREKPPFSPAEPPERFCVRSPRYEDYVVRDLVADVDATYRTAASRASRGIGGLSMGGFGALSLALRHQDLFAAVASSSGLVSLRYAGPHPYRDLASARLVDPRAWGQGYPERVRDHVLGVLGGDPARWRAVDPASLALSLSPDRLAIHLDCGEDDDFRFDDHARHLHDVLASRGVEHELAIEPGRHLFDYWKARLPSLLGFFRASLAPPR